MHTPKKDKPHAQTDEQDDADEGTVGGIEL